MSLQYFPPIITPGFMILQSSSALFGGWITQPYSHLTQNEIVTALWLSRQRCSKLTLKGSATLAFPCDIVVYLRGMLSRSPKEANPPSIHDYRVQRATELPLKLKIITISFHEHPSFFAPPNRESGAGP